MLLARQKRRRACGRGNRLILGLSVELLRVGGVCVLGDEGGCSRLFGRGGSGGDGSGGNSCAADVLHRFGETDVLGAALAGDDERFVRLTPAVALDHTAAFFYLVRNGELVRAALRLRAYRSQNDAVEGCRISVLYHAFKKPPAKPGRDWIANYQE